ncbi:MAG: type II secretion system major pseudopilin GspG [Pseudomonadota bacterium]
MTQSINTRRTRNSEFRAKKWEPVFRINRHDTIKSRSLSVSNKTLKDREAGVSLFELLVVLTIMALIATLIAPRVVGYLGRAKSDVARSQMANLATSMELFYLDLGRYPTAEEGLLALIEAPADAIGWRGPYFKDAAGLTDPWGAPYQFSTDPTTETFEILSFGRDGEEGGENEDADLRAN